jgi:hypothetical protein
MFPISPRAIIMIAASVFLLLLGGWGGYKIGQHGADELRQQLAKDASVGKVVDTAHDQLVVQLKTQNAALQKSYDDLKAQKDVAKTASDKVWADTLAKKDLALELATKNSTQAQVQVNALKAALFLAMTPDEKETLKKQLDGAQAQLVELQARTDGLKCLSVKIPQEYLDATNSTVPATPGSGK